MVSLSLFAGPERILRRFSVFAEEPRKSIITAIEPCNPVFKEAQPRPSRAEQSVKQAITITSVLFELSCSLLVVQNVLLMLVIIVVIKHPTGLCQNKGISVFFWIFLSPEVSRHFPTYTHTSTYANFKNLLYICCTLADIPLY